MRPKVLLTHPLLPEAMDYLSPEVDLELATEEMILPREELLARITDKQGLLCFLTDVIDRQVIDRAPALKIISNCAVGVNLEGEPLRLPPSNVRFAPCLPFSGGA